MEKIAKLMGDNNSDRVNELERRPTVRTEHDNERTYHRYADTRWAFRCISVA